MVMYHIVTGLSESGIRCDMLCAACDSPADITLGPNASIFATRTIKKIKATMISPAMITRLRKICRHYDIIHIHHPDPMAALALRLSGYKGRVVLHWHSDILRQRQLLRLFKPLQQWLIGRADVIVGTSPVYLSRSPWLRGVQHKCTCIPIGVDIPPEPDAAKVDKIRASYPGKKIIFSMGRLVEYKGFEFLIKSAQYLTGDYVVVIGGSGPLRQQLQNTIDTLGLQQTVHLVGFIDDNDLSAWYRASSLFCLSSVERTEAFGVVQIEAMSLGTPVVATKIEGSGTAWVNAHGVSGLNVPPRRPKELAGAIMEITGDPRTLQAYSQRALKRHRELFLKQIMTLKITALYHELLDVK